jgi:hypothetical protein
MPDIDLKDAPNSDGKVPPAKLAVRPVIAVDTREQSPLKFTRLEAVERALFDYSREVIKLAHALSKSSHQLQDTR